MKKPSRKNAGGGGRSGDDHDDGDRAFWEHVAKSIKPLKTKSRVLSAAAPKAKIEGRASGPPPSHSVDHPAPVVSQRQSTPPSKAPPLADFNPKHVRKIRSGRVEIERRVDLHGMRRNEAHGVLRRFLFDCHAQGRRCVLVITGKGDPRRRRDDEYGWGTGEHGVLRREVPMWLAEPELRAIVVSFTTAAAQHGGEGALYVHLRRPERTG